MLQQTWTNSVVIPTRRVRPTWEELLLPKTEQKATPKQSFKINDNTVKPEPAPPGPDPEATPTRRIFHAPSTIPRKKRIEQKQSRPKTDLEATPTERILHAPPAVPKKKISEQKQKHPEIDLDATPTGRMLHVPTAVTKNELAEQKKKRQIYLGFHSSPSKKLTDALDQKKVCSLQNCILLAGF